MNQNALLDAAATDMQIDDAFQKIENGVAEYYDYMIDTETVNDIGGFTVIYTNRNGIEARAGVLATMDATPKIAIGLDLFDAIPLMVGDRNSVEPILEIHQPESNQTHRIQCSRVANDTANPLVYFETSLPRFTDDRLDLCVWLITTLFERADSV